MPGAAFLETLYEYNAWANDRVTESLRTTPQTAPKALGLFSHIFAAQEIWYARITGSEYAEIVVFPEHTLERCAELNKLHYDRWNKFLQENQTPELLTRKIAYLNTKGISFEKTLLGIMIHVVNHSTYHRGQIAQLVKGAGGIPAVTDYIMFTQ